MLTLRGTILQQHSGQVKPDKPAADGVKTQHNLPFSAWLFAVWWATALCPSLPFEHFAKGQSIWHSQTHNYKVPSLNHKDQNLQFSWNFWHWKTAFGGFSSPDLEKQIKIDGSTLYLQLRKEKFGGLVTFKFASFTNKNYYSMSLDQLSDLRNVLDELDKEARTSSK